MRESRMKDGTGCGSAESAVAGDWGEDDKSAVAGDWGERGGSGDVGGDNTWWSSSSMLISLIVCKEPITADEGGGTLGAVGGDMDDAGGESGGYGESDGEAIGSSVSISWVVCKGDKRGLEDEQDGALGNQ